MAKKERKTVRMLEKQIEELVEELEFITDADEHKIACGKIERLEKLLATEKNFANHAKHTRDKYIETGLKAAGVAVPIVCTGMVIAAESQDSILRSKAFNWIRPKVS